MLACQNLNHMKFFFFNEFVLVYDDNQPFFYLAFHIKFLKEETIPLGFLS